MSRTCSSPSPSSTADAMNPEVTYVLVIIVVALTFDFINGFHDSANSIATVVSTRVLSPGVAVIWAAGFNFLAAFVLGAPVAKTLSKGLIDPAIVTPGVLMAALIGAIVWNLVTWYLGLPSSSSHALIGGFGGAAVAKAGISALILSGWVKPIIAIVLSPFMGGVLGLALTSAIGWTFRNAPGALMDKVFKRLQLVSAGLFSLSHGANDAQKTMGIIVGLLVATNHLFLNATGWQAHLYLAEADHVPMWVEMAAYAAIACGTALGGGRIVKTMGSGITKL